MPDKKDFLVDAIIQAGETGKRLADLGMAEGAAGNISICFRDSVDASSIFPVEQPVSLPCRVPGLAGAVILVTGSGRRLREIIETPTANLACIRVDEGGESGQLYTAPDARFKRVTSEFNSHLAIHQDQMQARDISFHAIVHAQPTHLTYLSHIPAYQDEQYFNRHLFRWQPETILSMPKGIGMLPFIVNGSDAQMTETVRSMLEHEVVVWARHGVVARADNSILHALDLIEYAESAAHYETLNLSTGEKADGLSPEQIRAICQAWKIDQSVY